MSLQPIAGQTKSWCRQFFDEWTTGRWRSERADLGRGVVNKMDAALQYAALEWPVFPVHTPTGDHIQPCSCRRITCPRIGKHSCHKNTCKDGGKHPCHQSVCDSA